MARGKHNVAAQRRYDTHAEARIQELEQALAKAKVALRNAEQKAAEADRLKEALHQATSDRDATTGPEVRRLNGMVASLQEKVRDAGESDEWWRGRWDELLEKAWRLAPGGRNEKWEWILDALSPTRDEVRFGGVLDLGVEPASLKDSVGVARIQRARGYRSSAKRYFYSIDARLGSIADWLDRTKSPPEPVVIEAMRWLIEQVDESRNLLRAARDFILIGEAEEARDLIADALSKPPEQPTAGFLPK